MQLRSEVHFFKAHYLQDLKKGRGRSGARWLAIKSRPYSLKNTPSKVGVICVALRCLHSAQQLHSAIGKWVVRIACITCIRLLDAANLYLLILSSTRRLTQPCNKVQYGV